MNRQELLAHLVDDDERLFGSKILDRIEQALRNQGPVATPFLDPHERDIALGIIGSVDSVRVRCYGGYKQAERQRLVIYPEYYLPELIEVPIRALQATGNFARPPSHREALGAIMGLGITRGQVGDILPTADGCQVIVPAELVDLYVAQFTAIGRTPVSCEEIDFEQLAVEPERVREIRTTVASLRLDAVAAAGFGTSRTKMAREIKQERVKVNWQVVSNPSAEVKEGDVISIRGRGRVVIESAGGKTRKGRISAVLVRYI